MQLDGKNATMRRLTGALHNADKLPADILTSQVFVNLGVDSINGNETQRKQVGTLLDRMLAWRTQTQERPAGVSVPDERSVRYQPRWEIGPDVISEGQRLWQKLQSLGQDMELEQRLPTVSASIAWISALKSSQQNNSNGEVLDQEAAGNA